MGGLLIGQVDKNDDGGSEPFASKITLTVSTTETYTIIVHAWATDRYGTADLVIKNVGTGATLYNQNISFGGGRVDVHDLPHSTSYEYETVLTRGGSSDTKIYALQCSSLDMVQVDDDYGTGLASYIKSQDICQIIIGAYSTNTEGTTTLYVNDHNSDNDGDGLGAGLENALGTCDNNTQAGCTEVFNPKDTDGDGLLDNWEVYGVDAAWWPQHLPMWGANPRHKDIFIEVDYTLSPTCATNNDCTGGTLCTSGTCGNAWSSNPMTEADVIKIQAYFNVAKAADVRNPDGQDGISLHFDLGKTPTNQAYATLYGNWGGSGAVPSGSYYRTVSTYTSYFSNIRRHVFRYALAENLSHLGKFCGGEAPVTGDHMVYQPYSTGGCANAFAHELGHSVGLHHYGDGSWGKVNCKPHYKSIMNYSSGHWGPSADKFAAGDIPQLLQPSNILETTGLGFLTSGTNVDPTYLQGDPFWLMTQAYMPSTSLPTYIDWNRNGIYDTVAVRASVTWERADCGNLGHKKSALYDTTLIANSLPTATPKILRRGDKLYIFYMGTDRKIYYRFGTILLASVNGSYGSCQAGGDDISTATPCVQWQNPQPIAVDTIKGLSAVLIWDRIILAYVKDSDSKIYTLPASGFNTDGTINWYPESIVTSSITTSVEPELTVMQVDLGSFGGSSSIVGLFVLDNSDNKHKWFSLNNINSGWTSQGEVKNTSGVILTGVISPSIIAWPDPSVPTGMACGVFPDMNKLLRFYCFDKATNQWTDLTNKAFSTIPSTQGKPSLAYHYYRKGDGTLLSPSIESGQFWLTFTENQATGQEPRVLFSQAISTITPPGSFTTTNLIFKYPRTLTGAFHIPYALAVGTGISMYEDKEVAALKAVWTRSYTWKNGNNPGTFSTRVEVDFLPFADGTFTFTPGLKAGNDFRVMERRICEGLHNREYKDSQGNVVKASDHVTICGTSSDSHWGY